MDSLISKDKVLGAGTHGTVYQSSYSEDIAIKVFKNTPVTVNNCKGERISTTTCNQIAEEYMIHETLCNSLDKTSPLGYVPQVYGFKHFPSSKDPKFCTYSMEKLFPVYGNQLCHLSFNFPVDHYSENHHGIFMGMKTFKERLQMTEEMFIEVLQALGTMLSHFHYHNFVDAYDVEFVFASTPKKQVVVAAIDFDKVNSYKSEAFPYCLSRKMTESDYEPKSIKNIKDVAKLLSSTIIYAPLPSMPGYDIWKEAYLLEAIKQNQGELGVLVIQKHEESHS